MLSLFFYFCPEHVEDDAAAFGEQGDEVDAAIEVQGDGDDDLQGDGTDAATEAVQLPEADGLQGASTNGGGASGIIFRRTNSTCTLYQGLTIL